MIRGFQTENIKVKAEANICNGRMNWERSYKDKLTWMQKKTQTLKKEKQGKV